MDSVDVYLEIGSKKVFAGAVDWPGWCRAGRGEDGALQALYEAAARYARAAAGLGFTAPAAMGALRVVERLPGGRGTDFGAPEAVPAADRAAFDAQALARMSAVLRGCWQAFDEAAQAAQGKTLALGPRGGGRSLEDITRHVMESAAGYLSKIGGRLKLDDAAPLAGEWQRTQQAVFDGLARALAEGVSEFGPRGGKNWTPRYFTRRVAWHILDHAWEIEDRILP